jgi:hypothetical protein
MAAVKWMPVLFFCLHLSDLNNAHFQPYFFESSGVEDEIRRGQKNGVKKMIL